MIRLLVMLLLLPTLAFAQRSGPPPSNGYTIQGTEAFPFISGTAPVTSARMSDIQTYIGANFSGQNLSANSVTNASSVTDTLANWTNFGAAIGNPALGPVFNYAGSNVPAIKISRLIFTRGAVGSTASNDFADFEVIRSANYTGGSTINAATRIITTVSAGATSQEWNLVASCTTVSSANCIGSFSQGIRNSGGTAPIWGAIVDVKDATLLQSSLSGGAVVNEIDIEADGIDDATNATMIGGAGVRWGIDLVGVKQGTDTAAPEFALGLAFTESGNGHGTGPYFDSAIGSMVNFQARRGLDTRGFIVPTGVTDPVYGVMMAQNQVIEFNGSTSTFNPTPSRTLVYNSTLTGLQYLSGASELFSDTDAGLFTIDGTLAVAGTNLAEITNSGTLLTLKEGAAGVEVAFTSNATNGVLITPSATGGNVVVKPYGDATSDLSLQGAGSGKVRTTAVIIGGSVANSFTMAGAGNGSPVTFTAAGTSDTDVSFNFVPKGAGVLQVGGTAGVSCAANTVTLATLVVTKGLVTHC